MTMKSQSYFRWSALSLAGFVLSSACGNSDSGSAAGGGTGGGAGASEEVTAGRAGAIGKGGSPAAGGAAGAGAAGVAGSPGGGAAGGGAAGAAGGAGSPVAGAAGAAGAKPNILFVIMDDVGIDQMQIFGYGGASPPSTPNLGAVADSGVRFSNTWSMPACTVSRAVFFDGRYPTRTNVYAALGPNDLSNSMVSPFEMTAPKLLAKSGYKSGLFGKFHLALPGYWPCDSQAKLAMPAALGWNYFSGWLDQTGDPSSIDTTAGNDNTPKGTWKCGFVEGGAGGVLKGPCYQADGTCSMLTASGGVPPGRACRDAGGLLDPTPKATCQASAPSFLNFGKLSAHFVSPLVINHEDGSVEQVPTTDPRARKFRATGAVDSAIGWIKQQPATQPWMATVSFASAHTPVMQPPVTEEPAGTNSSSLDCSAFGDQRTLTDLMISSIDIGVARLLVETGLATTGPTGQLVYVPEMTNTMVVIVGDNGSLGNSVKAPFDPSRAKGTAYQTGVWVPLIVAGPLVKSPNRAVAHMVNIADIFQLFGEIAGIDVPGAVPRPIDSASMLPYLTDPAQGSIRTSNFTQIGHNLQLGGAVNGPCLIGSGCTHIPVSKSVCEDNGGCWYGEGYDPLGANCPQTSGAGGGAAAPPFARCCQVVDYLTNLGQTGLSITPDISVAVRDDKYKVVQNTTWSTPLVAGPTGPCTVTPTTEFYAVDEGAMPTIDKAGSDLLAAGMPPLTAEQQSSLDALKAELAARLAVSPACPGDGNIDAAVNQQDLTDMMSYMGAQSSVYDLNLGMTCATAGQPPP
jgi:hypothetical protein